MRLAPLLLTLLLPGLIGPRTARAAPQRPDGVVRVWVEAPGFVRVKAAALRALGFAEEEHVAAYHRGAPLAMVGSRVGDDVVFLFEPGRERAVTPSAVLLRRGPALAPPALPEATALSTGPRRAGPSAPPVGPRLVRHRAPRRQFGELAAAERAVYDADAEAGAASPGGVPTWFAGSLAPGARLDLPPEPDGLPGSAQELLLSVRLTQPGPALLTLVHAGRAAAATAGSPNAPAPAQRLLFVVPDLDPGAPFSLTNTTPVAAAPPNDVSEGRGTVWLASWSVSGVLARLPAQETCAYATRAEEPWQALPGADPATLPLVARRAPEGRPAAPAYLERDATDPTRVWVYDADAPPGSTTYVARRAQDAAPEALPTLPDPVEAARGAMHVILATEPLLSGARRLAQHRSATGTPSVAIAAREVYEALADGERDPEALRAFLLRLRATGTDAPLRYVLLAGDAARDRADLVAQDTLPALMARTMYNGATPADALFVEGPGAGPLGAPAVGRLPFGDAATMEAFVDRLLVYERAPPRDRTRATLAFLANEARFGPVVDRLIEGFFRGLVARTLPPAYGVELTFASAGSPYLWPPREFNAKVQDDLNRGSLFYTYVGHGFAQGFDSLRIGGERYPVLHLADVERVEVRGTPPVLLAIACTTAEFDAPERTGLGEALLARPRGPIAYVGATRVCHPAGNTFLGRSFARAMFRGGLAGERRLGDVWRAARDEVLDPRGDDRVELGLLTVGTLAVLPAGTSLERVKREAFWLYNVLGDPGTRLALPERALTLAARLDGEAVQVEVAGLSPGDDVEVTLELPRDRAHPDRPATRGLKPLDPAAAAAIRANHARANDPVLRRLERRAQAPALSLVLTPADGERSLLDPAFGGQLQVRAVAIGADGVAVGSAPLAVRENSPDGPAAGAGGAR